jgi:DNA repair photolyase
MIKYKWYKERLDTIFAPAIKLWSNGISLKLDVYQNCNNFCKFCSSNSLQAMTLGRNGIKQNLKVARLVNIRSLINFFNRAFKNEDDVHPFMNWAIRNKMFIELGTTGETFQECDLDFRITYNLLKVLSGLHIPLFLNTKLNLICRDEEYKQLLINYKAPIFIQASFTSTDDKLVKRFEPLAPPPSERLRVIKELSQYEHIAVFTYISPFIPGLTDIDTEKFVNDILDAGMKGAHLRDFYIQGEQFQKPFWKKYVNNHKDSLETFPGGYHTTYEARINFLETAQNIALKRDPLFRIVGMKTKMFDKEVHYGKGVFDILSDDFKKGIVDFSIIPILRKIKENTDKPQVLIWNLLGYKKDKINYPEYIRTNEGDINNLMDWGCSCNKSEVELRIPGYDWIESGLWDGFQSYPSGFIGEVEGVYPVKDKCGEYLKDGDNYVYVFIPKEFNYLLKSNTNQSFLFTPDKEDLQNPYVSEGDIKDFIIPERLGGTDDKWINKEQLLNRR